MIREEGFVLYNMWLFDGEANRLQEGKSVVIDGDKISAVEDGGDASRFPGYKMVDMKGLTLLPGLIDNHVHMTVPFMIKVTPKAFLNINNQIKKNFQVCIDSGVTTVRDAGAFPRKMNYFKTKVEKGELQGPRVITTNSAITPPKGCPDWVPYFNPLVKVLMGGQYAERPMTPTEVKKVVKEMVDKGADWIKVYCQSKSWILCREKLPIFDRETFQALMDSSKKYGKKVCCHLVWLEDLKYVISMGVHTIEHSVLDYEIPDKVIEEFVKKDMALHPTLTILDIGNSKLWEQLDQHVREGGRSFLEPESLRQVKKFFDTYLRKDYPPSKEECMKNFYLDIPLHKRSFPTAIKNVFKLHKAGGRVGVGTDSGGSLMSFFGILYLEELKRMVEAGFSNYEALKAATSGNAKIIDMDDRIGSIRKGKLADLIAVEGNPLDDIEVIKDVKMVFKGGRLLKGAV